MCQFQILELCKKKATKLKLISPNFEFLKYSVLKKALGRFCHQTEEAGMRQFCRSVCASPSLRLFLTIYTVSQKLDIQPNNCAD